MRSEIKLHSEMGFVNPISGPQETFRAILKAMARPGLLVKIKSKLDIPDLFNPASAATFLTLLDDETPLWTDLSWNSSVINWFQMHCGCSVVTEPCMAHFALIAYPASMPSLSDFKIGDDEHLGSAATLIVQVDRFDDRNGKILRASGTKTSTHFAPVGLQPTFWEQWQFLAALYPTGVDVFFTHKDILAALPGKTRVSDPKVRADDAKRKGSRLCSA